MTPALSFSAMEILPGLLNRTKTQTIRLLFGKPRFYVGRKIKLYWKQRSKAKWFNAQTGEEISDINKPVGKTFRILEMKHNFDGTSEALVTDDTIIFQKLLGEAEITEVFEILLDKNGARRNGASAYGAGINLVEIIRQDGFSNGREMFAWFDKKYDLSTPKKFVVYRWRWL